MKRIAMAAVLAAAPVLLVAAETPTASSAASYTAIVQRPADPAGSGKGEMQVTIAIRRATPVEEALPLRDVLARGGQQALLGAIQNRAQGMLSLGGLEYPLDLVVDQQQGDHRHIVIVTTRPIEVTETNTGAASLDFPFGLAIFDVDGMGRGEGMVYPKAALEILPDGTVGVSTFSDRTYPLVRVQKAR